MTLGEEKAVRLREIRLQLNDIAMELKDMSETGADYYFLASVVGALHVARWGLE